MTTVDAVIIGAGHNGLVAANLLADAGWETLVLEAEDEPGGAVRTAEITAPGFRNDLCSAFYPLGAASPVLAGLGLERYGLRWRHAPIVLAHVLPDDRYVVLDRDEDRTAASVARFEPADGDAWHAECARWRRVGPRLLDALFTPFPPVRGGARLLRDLGVADALRFARFGVQPLRRYADERFGGAGARALVGGNALHTDLGPDSAGSAIFGWLLAMVGQHVGFPVPEGGAGALTGALVRRLTARGGRVECARPVTRVLVARGRALGVRDAGGELLRARRAVLADVGAPQLYGELVPAGALPTRLCDDLRRFQWDNDVVKVDWAVGGKVPWTAAGARDAGTVHLGADLDGLTEYAADLVRGQLPRSLFALIGQMTTADPSRSPAGTESLWAYTHVPHGRDWTGDDAERYGDRVDQLIERHAPGFRDLIQARSVAAPGVGGRGRTMVNGGTAGISQQLIFRPVPGLGRADTPIDRLYLGSASAHPGGGVHGGPGANAAAAALTRAGLLGGAYAAGISAAHRAIYRD
jgi:phytoene dehydrogenase-like protein